MAVLLMGSSVVVADEFSAQVAVSVAGDRATITALVRASGVSWTVAVSLAGVRGTASERLSRLNADAGIARRLAARLAAVGLPVVDVEAALSASVADYLDGEGKA